ncbi:hypothetical protein COCC4DRAFT_35053, partial [Bipolaris maydis ATCC 48331]
MTASLLRTSNGWNVVPAYASGNRPLASALTDAALINYALQNELRLHYILLLCVVMPQC